MNEWVLSNVGMILTGKTELLGEEHYTECVVGEWMSMEQWWNHNDRGNWSAGRRTLYSMGGMWINEWSNGGMLLTGETEVLGEKHYTGWVVGEWMSIEKWWNDTDRRKLYYRGKTLYSICGSWMNEFGALVEWYWQGKTEVQKEKHYTLWVVSGWMSGAMVEWYWQGKPETLAERLSMTNPKWNVIELRRPFMLFSCYISCKDSHIIDEMCFIIICNCWIKLKEVKLK